MSQHWVTRDADFVFITADCDGMPYSVGCKKITKEKYKELADRPRQKSSVTARKPRKKKTATTAH